MDGGAWQAIVHEIAKSRTQLSDLTSFFSAFFINYNYRKENLTVFHEVELYYDLIIL